VSTVCVLGTTSVITQSPNDNRIEAWEVSKILNEADAVVPGIRNGRALRAWGGVRPLYAPLEAGHENAQGRDVKRTFSVIDHVERDGVRGLVTVVGGKLTTCRLMAEAAVNVAARQLGNSKPCTTADEPLPGTYERRYHQLDHRLHRLEHGEMPGELICECEMVTRPQLEKTIAAYGDREVTLDDLRRDLRLGMGPCQAGFCSTRAAGILMNVKGQTSQQATQALSDFVNERFKGVRPLLWGHQLRQFYLDELIYRRTLGLDLLTQHAAEDTAHD
jgi:glycerol-3-phosphate dehydrogenase